MAKQDDYVRYTIRVPAALYERVKIAAGERSINALIVEVLAQEFPAPIEPDEALLDFMKSYMLGMVRSASPEVQKQTVEMFERIETLAPESKKAATEHLEKRLTELLKESSDTPTSGGSDD